MGCIAAICAALLAAPAHAADVVLVQVKAQTCGRRRTVYRLRFVSIAGPQRVRVRLTTAPSDVLPGSIR
jgi:hypothetical protein